ncbi:amino acid ABC transporter substrate-binding protein [Vagococcus xieshaowenii]|uniref:Amino acid ABC transporter substrate-binding protein n=1 Tax=Vagococcus xieshaowenii TaxID=2562451 RepID=A0AAJ5EEY8_9ENTE|nr:amino acid ABC transporter substrate-binding protein [Vagococcus xieshaowenii]QCA29063.1 amino acid ABC transporter substrate-binding protein [Vagococcus xieshaowenii]TFZ40961.1 amino acid ABC transporter substrate-binding protein [Vagococcus xieshaowenii]
MKSFISVLLGIGLIVLGFNLTGCSNQTDTAKSFSDYEEKGSIVVGLDDSFVPMGFRNDSGELVGFDIELAKKVGETVGVNIEFQPIDWSMKETELKNGTIDAIWNGYTVTAERKEQVTFSQTYLKNDQVIVTMKKNKIQSPNDMDGKIVGLQEGSSGEDAFTNNPELLKDFVKDQEAISYPAYTEAFMDLEAGRIDGLLIDKIFADYYLSQKENKNDFAMIATEFPEEDYAIGFRIGETELADKINEAINQLITSGEAKAISEKWFGEDRLVK